LKLIAKKFKVGEVDAGGNIINEAEEVGYATKAVIARIAGGKSGGSTGTEEGVDGSQKTGHDKGSEEGGEGASLACTFLHRQTAPRTIIPFEVHSIRFVVKECNQWKEFGEGSCNNIFEFFT